MAPGEAAAHHLPLSAFIVCLNEEKYLGNCIESVRDCREIVIVDSGSTDGTVALIQSYIDKGWPIRLFAEAWRGYSGQKQFALERCTQEWCFNIDADERFDDALRAALPDLLATQHVAGWRIPWRPYLIGYGYTPPNVSRGRNLRLFRRERGRYDLSRTVHEGIILDGRAEPAPKGSLLHYRPLLMDEQILKENKYSSLKADEWVNAGKSSRRLRLIFNPPAYFLRIYFRNGLWRCGLSGFIDAMTGAVYSFMTEAKVYQRHTLRGRPSTDDLGRKTASGEEPGEGSPHK